VPSPVVVASKNLEMNMNWQSEMSLLWLPPGAGPYPEDFAKRAEPGNFDFFYVGLDAFSAIEKRWQTEPVNEPWVFVLAENRLLSPEEIKATLPEWRDEMRAALTNPDLKDVEAGSDADATPLPEVGETPPDPNKTKLD